MAESKVVSFRLTAEEAQALAKKKFNCPTCRQEVSNANTIIRMLIRKQLGIDLVKEEDD
jgi:transcription elongation factor Elf1